MKKIINFSIVSFLIAIFVFSFAGKVNAQNNQGNQANKPAKSAVAACMKTATAAKKTALSAAQSAYKTALSQAKTLTDKKATKQARTNARSVRKDAQKAAKTVFATARKACVAGAGVADREVKISLLAQNNSGISGQATLEGEEGKTKVEIEVSGVAANSSMPAHIHMGACPTPGAVKYPLTNIVNGKSETVLNIPLSQLKGELPLAVNLHKSAAEASVYTSCGDVSFPQ